MLLLLTDCVDASRRAARVEDFSLLIKVYLKMIGGFLEVQVFRRSGGVLTDCCRNFLQQHLLQDVVEGYVADSVSNVGGQLLWASTFSGETAE